MRPESEANTKAGWASLPAGSRGRREDSFLEEEVTPELRIRDRTGPGEEKEKRV